MGLGLELAIFRRLQGGRPSFFITIARKLLPENLDSFTLTIVDLDSWRRGKPLFEHVVKRRGRSVIHGSLKVIINKEVVEALGLEKSKVVWVRVLPYDNNNLPEVPRVPYIAKPVKIHTDRSSLFFVISSSQIEYLRMISPGEKLHVYVHKSGKLIDYIRRPTYMRNNICKIILPSSLFQGLIRAHEIIHVRIETAS